MGTAGTAGLPVPMIAQVRPQSVDFSKRGADWLGFSEATYSVFETHRGLDGADHAEETDETRSASYQLDPPSVEIASIVYLHNAIWLNKPTPIV